MPPKPPFKLSPEQLALQAARRELKAQKQAQSAPQTRAEPPILHRDWALTQHTASKPSETVTIMTWNLLAQSLVRRELFPGNDALKFSTRGPMLSSEILAYDADILCLQEVDKLDTLLPAIESRYSHIYASGRSKNHGCMVLFKKGMYEEMYRQTLYYDEEDVRQDPGDDAKTIRWRRGVSRTTKNIGLISALRRADNPNQGVVVATTHLFWHPAYSYERTKQAGLLLRAVARVRASQRVEHWPCFVAGDFNLTPNDATYSLLVGEAVTDEQRKMFEDSRLVHISVDPTINRNSDLKPYQELTEKGEGGGAAEEEDDPDKAPTNSRPCQPEDGLLTFEEVEALYKSSSMELRSVYDESSPFINGEPIETISQRVPELKGRKGGNEPLWTSYTFYWKATLDYIFLFAPDQKANAEALLRPHRTAALGSGLPKQKVCGSDHVSLAARIAFEKQGSE